MKYPLDIVGGRGSVVLWTTYPRAYKYPRPVAGWDTHNEKLQFHVIRLVVHLSSLPPFLSVWVHLTACQRVSVPNSPGIPRPTTQSWPIGTRPECDGRWQGATR